MDNKADLSIGIVATAPSSPTAGTSLVLQPGQGVSMPATPFKALAYDSTLMPTRNNAEIIRVTARSTDTLTIQRAQGVSTAQSIAVGWVISNNVMAGDIVDVDKVDGFNASSTPTANTLLPLNANAKFPASVIEDDYSTSEVATHQKWVDGKTIYRKTINFGTLPNTTTKSVAHGITGLDYVIKYYGVASNGTNRLLLPYPTASTTIETYIDGTNVSVITSSNRSTYTTCYITMYYTK